MTHEPMIYPDQLGAALDTVYDAAVQLEQLASVGNESWLHPVTIERISGGRMSIRMLAKCLCFSSAPDINGNVRRNTNSAHATSIEGAIRLIKDAQPSAARKFRRTI